MPSTASTVAAYLAELPPERRAVVAAVLDTVRRHVPAGYEESMQWGGITWSIPLARYPDTYNGQPLAYVSLAAQKGHYALYLVCASLDPALTERLRAGFARAGRKLDMGKSCLRFRSLDDLPLDLIAEVVGSRTPAAYIGVYERSRGGEGGGGAKRAAKTAAKTAAKGGAKGGAKSAGTARAPAPARGRTGR